MPDWAVFLAACNSSDVPLTKFHEQGEQDPERDLKGLPDVFEVEGQDWESLFVRAGVSFLMGVPLCPWIFARLVVPWSNITTRVGNSDENEQ